MVRDLTDFAKKPGAVASRIKAPESQMRQDIDEYKNVPAKNAHIQFLTYLAALY